MSVRLIVLSCLLPAAAVAWMSGEQARRCAADEPATAAESTNTEASSNAEESLHAAIDRLVAAASAQKVARPAPGTAGPKFAAGPADDEEFFRRLSLDLTGVVPRAETVRAFRADSRADKRTRWIDQLLASDEHAAQMAVVFDVLLMERRPDKHVPTVAWRKYLADSFRAGKPLDQLVRELLDSDGATPELRPAAKFLIDREAAADVVVRDLGRLLLGIDLQCAQCHDHPSVADYRHEHYYGLQAFVGGLKLFKQPDGMMVLQENFVREVSFASVFDPGKSKKTGPRLPGGPAVEIPEFKAGEEYVEKPSSKVRAAPKFSLRHALAESLPRPETKPFARNFANRLWAQMMGVGLVRPLDMHHAANPPSHPELLDLLAERLAAMKFDTRQFLRELALSDVYQRSSLAPAGVAADELPAESYTIANLKGLSPESLFASLVRATGNETTLERQLDELLAARPAAEREKWAADESLRATARAEELVKRANEFADLFGGGAGAPDPEFQPSLPQALFLANGPSIASWLVPQHDNLTARLEKLDDAAKIVEETYVSLLARSPSDDEKKIWTEHLAPPRLRAIQEMIWALIASAEFRLNH